VNRALILSNSIRHHLREVITPHTDDYDREWYLLRFVQLVDGRLHVIDGTISKQQENVIFLVILICFIVPSEENCLLDYLREYSGPM
jgi:hypothetical protein